MKKVRLQGYKDRHRRDSSRLQSIRWLLTRRESEAAAVLDIIWLTAGDISLKGVKSLEKMFLLEQALRLIIYPSFLSW